MQPRPDYNYKCPKCGNILSNRSLMSENPFPSKLYSDWKKMVPMLPEFPDLTKCKECKEIFWLSDLKEIGASGWEWEENESTISWNFITELEFLTIDDYYRIVESGFSKDKNEEQYIRMHLWWAYNDRLREGKRLFLGDGDELRWTDNCQKLKVLFDPEDVYQKLLIAELNRNMGNFNECMNILQGINDNDLNWVKDKLISQCKKSNRWVVDLN